MAVRILQNRWSWEGMVSHLAELEMPELKSMYWPLGMLAWDRLSTLLNSQVTMCPWLAWERPMLRSRKFGGLAGVLAAGEFKLERGVHARQADEFAATTYAEASETPEGWASRCRLDEWDPLFGGGEVDEIGVGDDEQVIEEAGGVFEGGGDGEGGGLDLLAMLAGG